MRRFSNVSVTAAALPLARPAVAASPMDAGWNRCGPRGWDRPRARVPSHNGSRDVTTGIALARYCSRNSAGGALGVGGLVRCLVLVRALGVMILRWNRWNWWNRLVPRGFERFHHRGNPVEPVEPASVTVVRRKLNRCSTVVQLSLKRWEYPTLCGSFTLHKKKYKNQRKRPPAAARALFAEVQERGTLAILASPPAASGITARGRHPRCQVLGAGQAGGVARMAHQERTGSAAHQLGSCG